MPDKTSRDLTPADLRVFEPDLLGAIGFVLYGREAPPSPRSRKLPKRDQQNRSADGAP